VNITENQAVAIGFGFLTLWFVMQPKTSWWAAIIAAVAWLVFEYGKL
jgi:hypothetical protein